jgi:REP element-mobilizing transposase RayT
MSTYYKNHFRNESIRLQNWDYRWDSSYFITICAKKNYFGEINNNKMHLSPIGVLADIFWCEIKHHAKNVILESFVVMPNHIHGIITLNGGWIDYNNMDDGNVGNVDFVGIGHALSLQNQQHDYHKNQSNEIIKNSKKSQNNNCNRIPWDTNNRKTIGQKRFQNIGKNSISSIIGSYKSTVTRNAKRLGFEFEWQKLFYENIIRNEESHKTISNYINNNVKNWNKDRFYAK